MRVRRMLFKCVATVAMLSTALAVSAQEAAPVSPPSPLSKKAQAVKRKIANMPAGAHMTVVFLRGGEAFGELASAGPDSFTFHDVDRKADVTLGYSEVKKVKSGYGGFNTAAGRHTDRTKGIVITCVVLGALGILIGAAAAARN